MSSVCGSILTRVSKPNERATDHPIFYKHLWLKKRPKYLKTKQLFFFCETPPPPKNTEETRERMANGLWVKLFWDGVPTIYKYLRFSRPFLGGFNNIAPKRGSPLPNKKWPGKEPVTLFGWVWCFLGSFPFSCCWWFEVRVPGERIDFAVQTGTGSSTRFPRNKKGIPGRFGDIGGMTFLPVRQKRGFSTFFSWHNKSHTRTLKCLGESFAWVCEDHTHTTSLKNEETHRNK